MEKEIYELLKNHGKPVSFSPSELAYALEQIVQKAIGYDLNGLKSLVEENQRENSKKWKDMEEKEKQRDEKLSTRIKDLMKYYNDARKEEWDERAKKEWNEEEEFKKHIANLQERLDGLLVSSIVKI